MDAAFRRGFLLFYIIDTYNEFFLKNKLQHDSKGFQNSTPHLASPSPPKRKKNKELTIEQEFWQGSFDKLPPFLDQFALAESALSSFT